MYICIHLLILTPFFYINCLSFFLTVVFSYQYLFLPGNRIVVLSKYMFSITLWIAKDTSLTLFFILRAITEVAVVVAHRSCLHNLYRIMFSRFRYIVVVITYLEIWGTCGGTDRIFLFFLFFLCKDNLYKTCIIYRRMLVETKTATIHGYLCIIRLLYT